MNKYQIAVRFFEQALTPVYLNSFTKKFCKRYDDKLNDLRELVEKVTPKKVEHYDEEQGYFECPSCRMLITPLEDGIKSHKYCLNCGQALEGSLLDYKKVKGISVSHEGRVGNCPNCNALVAEFEDNEKCEKCGQKLDWSTENDE